MIDSCVNFFWSNLNDRLCLKSDWWFWISLNATRKLGNFKSLRITFRKDNLFTCGNRLINRYVCLHLVFVSFIYYLCLTLKICYFIMFGISWKVLACYICLYVFWGSFNFCLRWNCFRLYWRFYNNMLCLSMKCIELNLFLLFWHYKRWSARYSFILKLYKTKFTIFRQLFVFRFKWFLGVTSDVVLS